jgi:O-antigen ligase
MRNIALAISLLLSFMIPWEGVIRVAGLGNGTKILGFVLTAFWVVTILSTKRLRKPAAFQIVFYLFVIWNAITAFWSANPDETIAFVSTYAQLLILALIWWDLYTTRASILAGLQAYVLGAYVSAGGAIANFFTGNSFYDHYDRYSPGETNPDGFGFIMVLGIPVAWYLATTLNNTRFSSLFRLLNYAYIPTALLGIALSGTRTALVAAVPAMIYGLSTMTRVKLWARIAIFLLFAAAAFILVPRLQEQRSFQRLGTTTTELTEGDLNNRTNNWREGLATFAEHPFVGVGSGMYPTVNSWGKAAHNTFLSILVEAGLIGFALFMIMVIMSVTSAWKLPSRWASRFWLALLVVWTIGASTLSWGHRKPTWLFFNLLIASAAVAWQQHKQVARERQDEPEPQLQPMLQPSSRTI